MDNWVCRFYVSQSAYVYGGNEADKCSPALGQREIQEKVDSLGFRDVHASIKQVDALPSGGNGILIQVCCLVVVVVVVVMSLCIYPVPLGSVT